MTVAHDLLTDLLGRIQEHVHDILDGADEQLLLARPGPEANSIAWLLWHLTRVQDDHVSEIAMMLA